LFTAKVENNALVPDLEHLTFDLDPDNEFLWNEEAIKKVQIRFEELIDLYKGQELNDYSLRKIGSDLEGRIRQLLQAGDISYNPECRVLNYSMGLPRTTEIL
tara:strand:- start:65 stop:370 length:306 start_codon:yes stop_codon:yes gene_type:complete